MKKAILLSMLFISQFAFAESAWNYDSCMENVIRQFSCSINGKQVAVDLESQSTELAYKAGRGEKIYGIFVKNIANGELYIKCDDSGELKQVQYQVQGSSQVVSCLIF